MDRLYLTRRPISASFLLGFVSMVLVAIPSSARADSRSSWDVRVDYRIFAASDYSDYVFYVCRSTRVAPEKFKVSTDKGVLLKGELDGKLWIAAVPLSKVKELGGEEKVAKALVGDPVDGVFYSSKMKGVSTSSSSAYPLVENYDITRIGDKGITLEYLTPAQAKKRSGSGSGSGSGSSLLSIFSPWDDDPSGWDRLRGFLAGAALSLAVAVFGIWAARRWLQPRVAAPERALS